MLRLVPLKKFLRVEGLGSCPLAVMRDDRGY
jgi:hypothetical protein